MGHWGGLIAPSVKKQMLEVREYVAFMCQCCNTKALMTVLECCILCLCLMQFHIVICQILIPPNGVIFAY